MESKYLNDGPNICFKILEDITYIVKRKKDFSMEEQLGMINHLKDIKKYQKNKGYFSDKKTKFKFYC